MIRSENTIAKAVTEAARFNTNIQQRTNNNIHKDNTIYFISKPYQFETGYTIIEIVPKQQESKQIYKRRIKILWSRMTQLLLSQSQKYFEIEMQRQPLFLKTQELRQPCYSGIK